MAGGRYGTGFTGRGAEQDAHSGPGRAALVLKAALLSAVGILGLGLGCVPPQPMVKSDALAPEPSAVATLAPSPTEAVTPEASPAVTPAQVPALRVRPRTRSLAGAQGSVSGPNADARQESPIAQVWTPTPISFPVHPPKAAAAESGFPWAAWLIGFGVVLAGLGMVGAINARRPKVRRDYSDEDGEKPASLPREPEPEASRAESGSLAAGEPSASIPALPAAQDAGAAGGEQAAVPAAVKTRVVKNSVLKTVKPAGSTKRRSAAAKKTTRKATPPSNVVPLKPGRKKTSNRGKALPSPAKKRARG